MAITRNRVRAPSLQGATTGLLTHLRRQLLLRIFMGAAQCLALACARAGGRPGDTFFWVWVAPGWTLLRRVPASDTLVKSGFARVAIRPVRSAGAEVQAAAACRRIQNGAYPRRLNGSGPDHRLTRRARNARNRNQQACRQSDGVKSHLRSSPVLQLRRIGIPMPPPCASSAASRRT